MLEEAVELVEVAVGNGQELRRVSSLRAADRVELDLELVAKALDAPRDSDEVASFEGRGVKIGVAEQPAGDGARAVAKLEREIGDTIACHEAVLARAREHAFDPRSLAELGNGRGCGGGRGGHEPMVDAEADGRVGG
jgi:hypothetical protein